VARRRAADFGCDVRIIQGTRTYAEQDALYAQGRTRPGPKVTNAKAGHSNHNFGLAVDLGIFRDGSYLDSTDGKTAERVHRAVAEAVETANLNVEWGGDWTGFVDLPHWEYRTGLTTAQKRERVAKGVPLV
jgi:peptidoglycan L-alanyl-D-glutamate endopeptidase CwlK